MYPGKKQKKLEVEEGELLRALESQRMLIQHRNFLAAGGGKMCKGQYLNGKGKRGPKGARGVFEFSYRKRKRGCGMNEQKGVQYVPVYNYIYTGSRTNQFLIFFKISCSESLFS